MHRRGALCRKSVDGGRDTGWTNRPSLIRYKFTCNNISVSPDEPPRFLSRLTNVSFRFFFISRFDDIVIVVKYYYFYYYRFRFAVLEFSYLYKEVFPFEFYLSGPIPASREDRRNDISRLKIGAVNFQKLRFGGNPGIQFRSRMIMGRIVWFVSH